MAEFPGARDRFVDESRVWIDQNGHETITLHGTGGNPNQTADQLGDYFETTPLKTSVHYGVDRNGDCDQYVWEKDGCGGEGILDPGHDPFWDQYSDNPNWHGFGIETENDITNSLPLTPPQKATLFKLVAYLKNKYNIPLSHIKGHFTLEPVNRVNCPGPNFPWDEMEAYLKGETPMATIDLSNPTVASHFVAAANGAWHCPTTNATIGGEILATYQKFGGDGLCGLTHWGLPLTPELPTGKPGTVFQRFERVTVAFDPNHTIDSPPGAGRVYEMHIDSGIGQDPRVTDLAAHIADLTKQLAALQSAALAQENTALKAKIVQAVKDLSS